MVFFVYRMAEKAKRNFIHILLIILSFMLTLSFSVAIALSQIELSDISDHWARSSIQYLSNLNVVKGYPDNTFKPENLMTRGEFASALCNLLKEAPGEQPSFKDIPKDHWAGKYAGALQKKGIIWPEEYASESYGIDGNISRMEIAKMLVRTSPKAVEATKDEEVYYPLTRFTDYYGLEDEIKRYVGILYSSQIMRGFPDNTFKLDQPATRAEIVTLLEKFMENRSKLENPYTEKKPAAGIVGNMYYVDKLELPQYLRAYNALRNITDEELPLKYRVDRVSIFNYDTYNEDTPGYNPEYKDLMERYQVLWRKLKEEGNMSLYNNNRDAFQKDEVKDLSGKNLLAVEYTVENTTPYLFSMQSRMVTPKLLTQKEFDDIKWMKYFPRMNLIIFDSHQIEQWENSQSNRAVWSDIKTYKITAFYYADYHIGKDERNYEPVLDFSIEDAKYIGFYHPLNEFYNTEEQKTTATPEQALIMKMGE